jgi:hypothetical protein
MGAEAGRDGAVGGGSGRSGRSGACAWARATSATTAMAQTEAAADLEKCTAEPRLYHPWIRIAQPACWCVEVALDSTGPGRRPLPCVATRRFFWYWTRGRRVPHRTSPAVFHDFHDGDMETPPTLQQLTDEIRDLALQVSNALERAEERDLVAATHLALERVSQRYRDFFAALSEGEKLTVERGLGRRLADTKRLASSLPRIGTITAISTPDRRVSGASEVGERRITGVSWGAGSRPVGTAPGRLKVGGDVEAWCTPCGGLKEHSVVAMVGDEPKQVVCQSCNARHGFRTAPARKAAAEANATAGQQVMSGSEREAQRRGDEKAAVARALANEIAAATDVRAFDPKARYRSGEIIVHPQFGRGKIETVLRSSLLVRFSAGGLKSVMLN